VNLVLEDRRGNKKEGPRNWGKGGGVKNQAPGETESQCEVSNAGVRGLMGRDLPRIGKERLGD